MSIVRRSCVRTPSALVVAVLLAAATSLAGGVDEDFVATMVPHHHGAIDLAQAELRYGRNEQLRRIAQEIIVTQREEITAMHLAIVPPGRPGLPVQVQNGGT